MCPRGRACASGLRGPVRPGGWGCASGLGGGYASGISTSFLRGRNQLSAAAAETLGQHIHLAASLGTSGLGATTPPARQAQSSPRGGAAFSPTCPGEDKGPCHVPHPCLTFHKTIVGGWPRWSGLEEFPWGRGGRRGADCPLPGQQPRQRLPSSPSQTKPLCTHLSTLHTRTHTHTIHSCPYRLEPVPDQG